MTAAIDEFCADGFLVVRGAVAPDIVSACVDVICHPFLVHRATWPHLGAGPRMVAQPEIGHREPFALRDGPDVSAVERAILRGLQ